MYYQVYFWGFGVIFNVVKLIAFVLIIAALVIINKSYFI